MTEREGTSMSRRASLGLGAAAAVATLGTLADPSSAHAAVPARGVPSDRALARSLRAGFRSAYARVNGVRLHYVVGGDGDPLVLLGGWPQTWWQFHKIMPPLARRYRVIAVDIRGMGSSDKPESGYDKKTMAQDIRELVRRLGYGRVHLAGHDIGAMVAYSFAANHPDATNKVALLDVAHPDESLYEMTMLPRFGQEPLPSTGYLWWFAFNQISGLPEQLLAGRSRYLIDWLFEHILYDQRSVGERERAIYAHAYSRPDAIRAGNGWYQAFSRDIVDEKAYGKITAPLLGLGGSHSNYETLRKLLPDKGTDVRVEKVERSGHYLPEEQPGTVIRLLADFLG